MFRVKHFCCGLCRLKTGAKIIIITTSLYNAFFHTVGVYTLFFEGKGKSPDTRFVNFLLRIHFTLSCFWFMFYGLQAVNYERSNSIFVFMVTLVIGLSLDILLMIRSLFLLPEKIKSQHYEATENIWLTLQDLVTIEITLLIGIVVTLYFLTVLYSYYKECKEMERDELIRSVNPERSAESETRYYE